MEEFQGMVVNHTNLQIHLSHHYVQYTTTILDEGNLPHPYFPQCNIFFPFKALNGRHPSVEMCVWGREVKRKHLSTEEAQAGVEASFFRS